MKKMKMAMAMAMGVIILMLSACGQAKNPKGTQADVTGGVTEISDGTKELPV